MVQSQILPIEHHTLVSTLTKYTKPKSYEEASKHPGWVEAMNKEIDVLNSNQTWKYVYLPLRKKAISSKWVYKVKLNSDGTLERLKARLVIRSFTQQYGINFQEVIFLVVKMATIRAIIALAATNEWILS